MSVGARNQRIDLIRGVSILLVLFHHFNIAYHLDDTLLARAFGWQAVQAVARNGNYGVTMFFVISGYLITSNADQRWSGLANVKAAGFYGLRVARIMPCLVLLLLVVNLLAFSGVALFQNHPQGGAAVPFWLVNVASLTFWMNVLIGREGWFNYPLGVLWSLSVEEVFYLSFPILCLILRREGRLVAFWVAIIVVGPIYRLAHQGDEGGYLYAYFACFDGIAIGCCTAVLTKHVTLSGRNALLLQVTTVVAMTVLYLWRSIGQTNVYGVTAMALGTAILLLTAHGQSSVVFLPRRKPLVALAWLGRHSYELYLFHLVVLSGIRIIFQPRTTADNEKLLLLVAFLALSAGVSGLIARFYAEPLDRSIRQLLFARAATAST